MSKPTNVKPCPFCGNKKTMIQGPDCGFFNVNCIACDAGGPLEESSEEAIKAWNAAPKELLADIAPVLRNARREHYVSDVRGWYSCPASEVYRVWCRESGRGTDTDTSCTCGAEAWNARIDALLARIDALMESE